jgi:5-deoxy-glucuronate isomerase
MKSSLHFTSAEILDWKKPKDLGLEFTSVRRVELTGGKTAVFETHSTEMCLVVIQGAVGFSCLIAGSREENGRAVFRDMIFLPPDSRAECSSPDGVLMAYEAPSELGASFGHIRFADVDRNPKTRHVYGKEDSGSLRDVWNFVDSDYHCSRLMLGICYGRGGGWTAWPPHEHGAEREEIYVYINMEKTFGVQLVYEDMEKPLAAAIVREGDMVSIPKGYHPNVGSPAGRISYVYCMTAREPGKREFMDLRIQKEFGDKFE